MNKTLLSALLMLFVSVSSCKKDDVDSNEENSENDTVEVVDDTLSEEVSTNTNSSSDCDTLITYENGIKRIMDMNCAVSNCHVNGYSHGDFSNYQSMASSVQDTNGSIYRRVVVQKNMPIGGYSLSESQIDSIACWIVNGSKEN